MPTLAEIWHPYTPDFGETVIGLSFSGGGMRASAFSYGAIEELAAHKTRFSSVGKSLIDDVVFVSGVSGGSVPAVYFALHGAKTIPAFRDNFLYKDPQSSLNTSISLFSLLAVLGGGLNSKIGFQDWLDENLLHDATFGDLARDNAPILWVNASDVYNDTVFTFDAATFAALCSDLKAFKLSEAVAASSAVPGVFSPIVIENFAGQCDYKEPTWIGWAMESLGGSLVVRNQARTLRRYRNRQENMYLKLYDGGVTDNLGVHGITTHRHRHGSPSASLLAANFSSAAMMSNSGAGGSSAIIRAARSALRSSRSRRNRAARLEPRNLNISNSPSQKTQTLFSWCP